jgi:hypothetical protein
MLGAKKLPFTCSPPSQFAPRASQMIMPEIAAELGSPGVERVTRIELALSAWEADVLPLNYTRARFAASLPGVPAAPGGATCPHIVPDGIPSEIKQAEGGLARLSSGGSYVDWLGENARPVDNAPALTSAEHR